MNLPAGLSGRLHRIAPALIALGLVLIGIVSRPLIPIDETRYLTVSWEMFQGHDWLVSHLNGQPYNDKPPLLFWLINLVWSITGASEFWGRLTPALFFPVSVWLTGVLGREIGGSAIADRAGYVAVGVTAFAIFGSLTMFDALLTSVALVGLVGLVDASKGHLVRGFAVAGLAIGFGVLTKGPVILIHLLPAALLAPLWAPRPQRWTLWDAGVAASLAIGAVIGLTWALNAAHAGGEAYGQRLLVGQTAGRVANAFTHKRPIWFFVALAPVMLFPWWLSRGFWAGVLDRIRGDERRMLRLCWIVAGATFLIFSLISSKQIHYVLPAIPLLAIGFAGLTVLPAEPNREVLFAPVLAGLGVITLALHFMPKVVGAPVAVWPGLLLIAAAAGVWFLRARVGPSGLAASVAVFLAVHLACLTGTVAPQDIAWVARRLQSQPEAPMAVIGAYSGEFGFTARLTKPIDEITLAQAPVWRATHPDGIVIEMARRQPRGGPYTEVKPYRGGTLAIWVPMTRALASADASGS